MNVAAILSILKNLWDNKVVRYALAGLIVFISALFIYNNRIDSAYDRGKADQVSIYEKEQKQLKEEYQQRLDAANNERLSLNSNLAKIKEDYAKLQSERSVKQTNQQNEVTNYAKTSDGNKRCLDPKWMQLYSNSLPD